MYILCVCVCVYCIVLCELLKGVENNVKCQKAFREVSSLENRPTVLQYILSKEILYILYQVLEDNLVHCIDFGEFYHKLKS